MRHLLLIDDSSIDVLLFESALEQAGYKAKMTTFPNGEGVLEYLQGHRAEVDAVVLDLNMPKTDGFAVLEQLRHLEHCPPVIVLTTSDNPRDRERSLALGAQDFITKPMQFDELMAIVARVLQTT